MDLGLVMVIVASLHPILLREKQTRARGAFSRLGFLDIELMEYTCALPTDITASRLAIQAATRAITTKCLRISGTVRNHDSTKDASRKSNRHCISRLYSHVH